MVRYIETTDGIKESPAEWRGLRLLGIFNFAAFSLLHLRIVIVKKAGKHTSEIAVSGNRSGLSAFPFENRTIQFKVPELLERYTFVKNRDNGCLVIAEVIMAV